MADVFDMAAGDGGGTAVAEPPPQPTPAPSTGGDIFDKAAGTTPKVTYTVNEAFGHLKNAYAAATESQLNEHGHDYSADSLEKEGDPMPWTKFVDDNASDEEKRAAIPQMAKFLTTYQNARARAAIRNGHPEDDAQAMDIVQRQAKGQAEAQTETQAFGSSLQHGFQNVTNFGKEVVSPDLAKLRGFEEAQMQASSEAHPLSTVGGNAVGSFIAPESLAMMAATGGISNPISEEAAQAIYQTGRISATAAKAGGQITASGLGGALYGGSVQTAQQAASGEPVTPIHNIALGGGAGLAGGAIGQGVGAATEGLGPVGQAIARAGGNVVGGGAINTAIGEGQALIEGKPRTNQDRIADFISGAAPALVGDAPGLLHDMVEARDQAIRMKANAKLIDRLNQEIANLNTRDVFDHIAQHDTTNGDVFDKAEAAQQAPAPPQPLAPERAAPGSPATPPAPVSNVSAAGGGTPSPVAPDVSPPSVGTGSDRLVGSEAGTRLPWQTPQGDFVGLGKFFRPHSTEELASLDKQLARLKAQRKNYAVGTDLRRALDLQISALEDQYSMVSGSENLHDPSLRAAVHRRLIEAELIRNNPDIPADVLRDYPDLIAKYPDSPAIKNNNLRSEAGAAEKTPPAPTPAPRTQGPSLSPELLAKAKAYDDAHATRVRDVTPKGFGPEESDVEPAPQRSPEAQQILNSIQEGETILRGKLSPEKRAQVEAALAVSREKMYRQLLKDNEYGEAQRYKPPVVENVTKEPTPPQAPPPPPVRVEPPPAAALPAPPAPPAKIRGMDMDPAALRAGMIEGPHGDKATSNLARAAADFSGTHRTMLDAGKRDEITRFLRAWREAYARTKPGKEGEPARQALEQLARWNGYKAIRWNQGANEAFVASGGNDAGDSPALITKEGTIAEQGRVPNAGGEGIKGFKYGSPPPSDLNFPEQGDKNAVPKQSPAGIPVRQEAQRGQEVREGNAQVDVQETPPAQGVGAAGTPQGEVNTPQFEPPTGKRKLGRKQGASPRPAETVLNPVKEVNPPKMNDAAAMLRKHYIKEISPPKEDLELGDNLAHAISKIEHHDTIQAADMAEALQYTPRDMSIIGAAQADFDAHQRMAKVRKNQLADDGGSPLGERMRKVWKAAGMELPKLGDVGAVRDAVDRVLSSKSFGRRINKELLEKFPDEYANIFNKETAQKGAFSNTKAAIDKAMQALKSKNTTLGSGFGNLSDALEHATNIAVAVVKDLAIAGKHGFEHFVKAISDNIADARLRNLMLKGERDRTTGKMVGGARELYNAAREHPDIVSKGIQNAMTPADKLPNALQIEQLSRRTPEQVAAHESERRAAAALPEKPPTETQAIRAATVPQTETTKGTILRTTGQSDESAPTTQAEALAANMKAQQKAAAAGYSEAQREAANDLAGTILGMKWEANNSAQFQLAVRQELAARAKQMPPEVAKAMASDIANARTPADYRRAVEKMERNMGIVSGRNAIRDLYGVIGGPVREKSAQTTGLRQQVDEATGVTNKPVNKFAKGPVEVDKLQPAHRDALTPLVDSIRNGKAITGGKKLADFLRQQTDEGRSNAFSNEQLNALAKLDDAPTFGGTRTVATLTPEEAGLIKQAAQHVKFLSDEANRANTGSTLHRVMETGKKVLQGILRMNPKSLDTSKGVGEKNVFARLAGDVQRDLSRLTGLNGGSEMEDAIYKPLAKGESNAMLLYHRGMDALKAVRDKFKVGDSAFVRMGTKQERIELPNGQSIQMTPRERMAFMANWGDLETRKAFADGSPMVLSRFEGRSTHNVRVTPDVAEAILKTATPFEREYVEAGKKFLTGDLADAVNAASVREVGFERANNPDYFPRRRDGSQSRTDILPGQQGWARAWLENTGALKERTGAKTPIVIGDYHDIFTGHNDKMSRYSHLAEPVRDILMLTSKGQNGVGIGGEMEQHLGRQFQQRLIQYMAKVSGMSRDSQWGHGFLSAAQRAIATGELGFRPTSAINHWLGGSLFAHDLSGREQLDFLQQATNPKNLIDGAYYKRMQEVNGYFRQRAEQHGANLESTTTDTGLDTLKRSRLGVAVGKLSDASLAALKWGDARDIVTLGKTLEKSYLRDHPNATPEEAFKAATERAEYIVRRNATTSSPLDQSYLNLRLKQIPGGGLISLFSSKANKIRNAADESIQNFRQNPNAGTAGKLIKTAALVGFNAMAIAGVRALAASQRQGFPSLTPQQEDERKRDAVVGVMEQLGDVMTQGGGQLVRSAAAKMEGKPAESSNILTSTLANIFGGTVDSANSWKQGQHQQAVRQAIHVLSEAGKLIGLPIDAPLGIGTGIYKQFNPNPVQEDKAKRQQTNVGRIAQSIRDADPMTFKAPMTDQDRAAYKSKTDLVNRLRTNPKDAEATAQRDAMLEGERKAIKERASYANDDAHAILTAPIEKMADALEKMTADERAAKVAKTGILADFDRNYVQAAKSRLIAELAKAKTDQDRKRILAVQARVNALK